MWFWCDILSSYVIFDQVHQQMWYKCEILSTWRAKMWPDLCIVEPGGDKGITKYTESSPTNEWLGILMIKNLLHFHFSKTFCSSSICFWVKASAGRKSSTCTLQARNLNFATLRVIIILFQPSSYIGCTLVLWFIFSGKRVETSDPCCVEKFANVIYTIRLWRSWNQNQNHSKTF